MNINKTIGENKFASKNVFFQIRARAIISSNWITNCRRHEILIVGER